MQMGPVPLSTLKEAPRLKKVYGLTFIDDSYRLKLLEDQLVGPIQVSALVDKYRSYHGFVSWLLIGVAGDGYVVDAQALRARLKSWRIWTSEHEKVVFGGADTFAVLMREFGMRNYITMDGCLADGIDWRQRP